MSDVEKALDRAKGECAECSKRHEIFPALGKKVCEYRSCYCKTVLDAVQEAVEREKGCGHCNMEHIDSPNDYDNQAIIMETGWTKLCFGVDENGRLYLLAVGDDETDRWYPRYCPWCGRDLTGGSENHE